MKFLFTIILILLTFLVFFLNEKRIKNNAKKMVLEWKQNELVTKLLDQVELNNFIFVYKGTKCLRNSFDTKLLAKCLNIDNRKILNRKYLVALQLYYELKAKKESHDALNNAFEQLKK